MKSALLIAIVLAATSALHLRAADEATVNILTDAEKAAGWKLLFDGKTLNGWSNFKKTTIKPGWQVKDGQLVCVDPHNAGDIVTAEKFGAFELGDRPRDSTRRQRQRQGPAEMRLALRAVSATHRSEDWQDARHDQARR